MIAVDTAGSVDFWRWVPHPEVWVLIGGLVALYVYAARVIGPKVVAPGEPAVTAAQKRWFAFGIILLWVAADWPVHDIGEQYLYFVHMSQHLVLTLVVPPVMLLATPEWLARLVVGQGRVERFVHRMARPVPAALAFNALALLSHWQVVVNGAAQNGLFHYGVHTLLVTSGRPVLDPGLRPVPRAPHLAAGADDLPVRHVDRADGPGGVADLRRWRGLLRLRHPGPAVGSVGHQRPAGRGRAHEAGRRQLPLGAHHGDLLPVGRP